MSARKRRLPQLDEALLAYRNGQDAKAQRLCREALFMAPGDVPTLSLMGKLELKAGRLQAAVKTLERVAQLAPTSVVDLCNLGVAYHRLKLLDQAVEVLARAVKLDLQKADAVFNLGLALMDRGDTEQGFVCLGSAARLKPESASIQLALARELMRAGRADEASDRFAAAWQLQPGSSELGLERLAALEESDRAQEAEQFVRHLLQTDPKVAALHAVFGRMLSKLNRYSEAVAAFRQALTLGHSPLTLANPMAFALAKQGRLEQALHELEEIVAQNPAHNMEHSNLVFHSMFDAKYDAGQLLDVARGWNERHARPLMGKRQPHSRDRNPDRKLRVAYVSPDFRGHVQRLFTLPVFRNHDHTAHTIICYSSVRRPDPLTEELKRWSDQWYEVRQLTDSELAQKIREDAIDVLVDLTMHMAGCRLKVFAEKPAPVQFTWLAYPGTTGVDGVDYRITDPHLDPPGAPLPYSEESLWLPATFWCYDPAGDEATVSELPAVRNAHVTFGCLNNFMKVNRTVLELWARVLSSVPSSRLLLLAPEGWSRAFVTEVFGSAGVSSDRVEFVTQRERHEYLDLYNRIDIALDTFPYNGHTTSLDAFWMGVPVVTLLGNTIVGRAGLSLAKNLDLDELVARDSDQFVQIATKLTSDIPRLQELRGGLRRRMESSPMMDAPGFTRSLEGLYREGWRRWCAQ
jgi:predicted O-linked N-acetylglucosamine transferase (SPINDLY family)